jgi:hypothetical protein
MPTPTYTPLATVTLGSATASVTFSSIPATYRDLILVSDYKTSVASNSLLRFNGDSGSNYSYVQMGANSSGVESYNGTVNALYLNVNSTQIEKTTTTILNVMDYSATDKHKTNLLRNNGQNGDVVWAYTFRWANTAAITTMALTLTSGNYSAGSTFALYGIAS